MNGLGWKISSGRAHRNAMGMDLDEVRGQRSSECARSPHSYPADTLERVGFMNFYEQIMDDLQADFVVLQVTPFRCRPN